MFASLFGLNSRKIDEVMRDFHGHKLLAHPIAAGEVEIKV
jgi:hypothetical protein